MVANVVFRRLREHLEPRYELSSRHYFTDTALPGIHNMLRQHLLALLSEVHAFGFTTDIWSSSVCPMSLLSFTAQWVDSSFNLQRAILHAQHFHGSHMAERVKQAIERMLNSWGIKKQWGSYNSSSCFFNQVELSALVLLLQCNHYVELLT